MGMNSTKETARLCALSKSTEPVWRTRHAPCTPNNKSPNNEAWPSSSKPNPNRGGRAGVPPCVPMQSRRTFDFSYSSAAVALLRSVYLSQDSLVGCSGQPLESCVKPSITMILCASCTELKVQVRCFCNISCYDILCYAMFCYVCAVHVMTSSVCSLSLSIYIYGMPCCVVACCTVHVMICLAMFCCDYGLLCMPACLHVYVHECINV